MYEPLGNTIYEMEHYLWDDEPLGFEGPGAHYFEIQKSIEIIEAMGFQHIRLDVIMVEPDNDNINELFQGELSGNHGFGY